ncbi:MAG: hypothetical protein ABIV10_04950, partial [Gemmatimonadaceae bacterium]
MATRASGLGVVNADALADGYVVARQFTRANFFPLKSSLVPSDDASRARKIRPDATVDPLTWLRPVRPWWALIVLLGLLLVSALFSIPPIRDAATLERVAEAELVRSAGYVLLAPLLNVFDVLTLLSVRQHIALLITLFIGYALWWRWRGRIMPPTVTPARRAARVVARVGLALLALLAVYFGGALLPRPMAAIEVQQNIVAVDFHAHTRFSHDGRPDWTPEDVRSWHRKAGFDAA